MNCEPSKEHVAVVLHAMDFHRTFNEEDFGKDEGAGDLFRRLFAGLKATEKFLVDSHPDIVAEAGPLTALSALDEFLDGGPQIQDTYSPAFISRLLSGAAERVKTIPTVAQKLHQIAAEVAAQPSPHIPCLEHVGRTELTPVQKEALESVRKEIQAALGMPVSRNRREPFPPTSQNGSPRATKPPTNPTPKRRKR